MRGSSLVGLALSAGLAAGGGWALRETAGAEDLWVDVPREGGEGAAVAIGPARVRVREARLREQPGPGLDWTRWLVSYGSGAYVREVVRAELRGEVTPADGLACGSELHVGAGLFDPKGAGAGLAELARREVGKVFPLHRTFALPLGQSLTLSLPKLQRLTLSLAFGEGEVYSLAEVALTDGTTFRLGFPARIVAKDGAPVLERVAGRDVLVVFAGPAREDVLRQARAIGGKLGGAGGCAVGMIFGPGGCMLGGGAGWLIGRSVAGSTAEQQIAARAPAEIAAVLDKKLAELSLGLRDFSRPFALDPARPGDTLRARLDGPPVVGPAGLTLPLCTSFTAGEPLVAPGAPGPLVVPGRARAERPADARFALALSPGAVHQALHYAWQSGLLRKVGQSPAVLAGLSERVKATALDFAGFDPRLPPTLSPHEPAAGALPLAVGDVTLGAVGARRANGHALLDLFVTSAEGDVRLEAKVRELHVGCVEARGAVDRLTPCLADLVPVAREMARDQPLGFTFSRADVLARLPAVAFQGLRLALTEPEARVSGAGLSVGLRGAFVVEER